MGVLKEVIGWVRCQVSECRYHKNRGLSTGNIVRFLYQDYVVDYLVEHK